MKWTKQAEEAVSKVPFFVRKRVKNRVEEEAARTGSREVTREHVLACKKRLLGDMEAEVKGFHVETCFGASGCPNRAVCDDDMAQRVEEALSQKNIRAILKERVKGPLKLHHEFQVTISDCPNACSRPQIADVGFIGARLPMISDAPCSKCGACIEACRENAIVLEEDSLGPVIDFDKCLACGQCISVCPTGTLREARRGYRILVGGKLGRHPQLGKELEGIFTGEQALTMLRKCIDFYINKNLAGERLGEILNRVGLDELINSCGQESAQDS